MRTKLFITLWLLSTTAIWAQSAGELAIQKLTASLETNDSKALCELTRALNNRELYLHDLFDPDTAIVTSRENYARRLLDRSEKVAFHEFIILMTLPEVAFKQPFSGESIFVSATGEPVFVKVTGIYRQKRGYILKTSLRQPGSHQTIDRRMHLAVSDVRKLILLSAQLKLLDESQSGPLSLAKGTLVIETIPKT